MRHPRLDAEGVVGAREGTEGFLIARGDFAATKAVVIISQHFSLGAVIDLPRPLERYLLATSSEAVVVAVGLERVGVVLRLGQTAGHIGTGVVVMQIEAEIIHIVGRPVGLEHHVIDVVAIVALTVTVAVDARIQQRHAHAVVRRTADERRIDVLPATVPRGFQSGAYLGGRLFRNRPGDEVDHPAHVLRSITDRAGAAHHVDAVEVAGGDRRHRQLRLAIGREGCRYAVNQYGGAWRQARRQAAHADVQGNIAAPGAVGVLHLHARYPLQHVADCHCALLDHGLATDHRACAGVVLHHGCIGIAEPIADHLDIRHAELQRPFLGGSRCGGQGHRACIDLIIQAAALQQLAQGLLGGKVTVHGRCLFAGDQLRAEKNLQRSLLAQLTQGLPQRLRLDVDGVGSKCLGQRAVGGQGQGQRQPG